MTKLEKSMLEIAKKSKENKDLDTFRRWLRGFRHAAVKPTSDEFEKELDKLVELDYSKQIHTGSP